MAYEKFSIRDDSEDFPINQLKQNLNLSYQATVLIKEDERNFSNSEKETRDKYPGSEILNRVFANFYQDADATISQRCIARRDELLALFSSKEFRSIDGSITKIFVDKILDAYKKELETKSKSYEKGVSFKFNLNKKSLDILRNSQDSTYYEAIIGLYLKPIFEEYALKPMYEREQIYFKETMNILESAIAQKKCVKMSILKKINPNSHEVYVRKFYLSPYKIIQDKSGMFNYVIGYSEEIKRDGEGTWPRKAVCYRISRIDHLLIMSSKSGFISKADQEELEKMIAEKDPMFLVGDVIEIKVKFTDKGIESFNRQLYMRPTDFKKVEGEENTYLFRCTEVQAINYFFKLARDVEILAPERTRDKFIQRYRDAYMQYVKDDAADDASAID
jgi:hypothetical protein